ncbi:MAG: amidohydrolase family protein [Sphingorhabdus sp.]
MLKKIGFASLGLLGALVIAAVFALWMLTPPSLSVPEREDRTLAGVTIWNPGEPATKNQTIIIRDGVISEIRGTRSNDKAFVCEGCFVMPGLIDAHIHTPPELAIGNQRLFSLLYLKYGITAVRDLGQLDDSVADLARDLNTGKIVGPRMYRCGPILDGNPPKVPGGRAVTTAKAGAEMVQQLADEDVDCIKVYDQLPRAAFQGIMEKAAELKLPLIGHTPHAVKMSEINNFESQHYTGIPYLHRSAPKGWAYKNEDLINLTPEEIAEITTVMKTNGISFLPTNANARARLTVSDSKRFPATKGLRHLPDFWKIAWPSVVSHPETEAEIEAAVNAVPAAVNFISEVHLGGVDVLAGTDVVMPYVIPGESLHLQIEILAQAFGSYETALKAATTVNGKHLDAGKIGYLKPGALADMLIFENDPANSPQSTKDWRFLIVGGRMYTREYIDDAVERYDRHFNGAFYTKLLGFAYSYIASDYEGSGVAEH